MKPTFLFCIFFFVQSLFFTALHAQDQDDKPLRNFQLSVFPMVGTDGTETPNYRYEFSLNLFAGMNGGVKGFEAGWFMNINQGNVEGFQGAGFANIVNGSFQGFQGAGFLNVINGPSRGINLAGFMNVVRGEQEGILWAGFMNVVDGRSQALAGAGFMNVSRGSAQGFRGAGFMNVTAGSFQGFQGAGFMNVVSGSSQGASFAGFGNVTAGDMQGIQGAGFMNVADKMQGIQLAGFLNVAGRAEGIQLGFINVSDTISGIPVGFLSVVRRGGLRQIEIATNDLLFTNASFKIGVPAFYNIFTYGITPQHDHFVHLRGYGIGTRINLIENSSFLNIEAHSAVLYDDWKWWTDRNTSRNNYFNELRVLYTHQITPHIHLFGGAVVHNYWNKPSDEITSDDLEIAPWTFYESTHNNWNSQWWLGARAGVSFVLR